MSRISKRYFASLGLEQRSQDLHDDDDTLEDLVLSLENLTNENALFIDLYKSKMSVNEKIEILTPLYKKYKLDDKPLRIASIESYGFRGDFGKSALSISLEGIIGDFFKKIGDIIAGIIKFFKELFGRLFGVSKGTSASAEATKEKLKDKEQTDKVVPVVIKVPPGVSSADSTDPKEIKKDMEENHAEVEKTINQLKENVARLEKEKKALQEAEAKRKAEEEQEDREREERLIAAKKELEEKRKKEEEEAKLKKEEADEKEREAKEYIQIHAKNKKEIEELCDLMSKSEYRLEHYDDYISATLKRLGEISKFIANPQNKFKDDDERSLYYNELNSQVRHIARIANTLKQSLVRMQKTEKIYSILCEDYAGRLKAKQVLLLESNSGVHMDFQYIEHANDKAVGGKVFHLHDIIIKNSGYHIKDLNEGTRYCKYLKKLMPLIDELSKDQKIVKPDYEDYNNLDIVVNGHWANDPKGSDVYREICLKFNKFHEKYLKEDNSELIRQAKEDEAEGDIFTTNQKDYADIQLDD